MKISLKQLRKLVQEAAPRQRRGTHKRPPPSLKASNGEHLSKVKEIDPAAYRAWVAYLVEDCTDKFHFLGDGRIRVETADGGELFWDSEYAMSEWESTPPWSDEAYGDDEPKGTGFSPRDPFESSRQFKKSQKK